jgi:plasmid stability protein
MDRNTLTSGRKLLHAHVAPEVYERLRELAGEHDRSMSAEVRSALRAYIQASPGGSSPPRVAEGRGAAMTSAAAGGEKRDGQ